MDLRGPTKGNTQLVRQNDFFFEIEQTSILFIEEKTKFLQSSSEHLYAFFPKEHHTA